MLWLYLIGKCFWYDLCCWDCVLVLVMLLIYDGDCLVDVVYL